MIEERLGETVIPGGSPETPDAPQAVTVKPTTGLTDGQPSKTVLVKDNGLISRVREALARIAGR